MNPIEQMQLQKKKFEQAKHEAFNKTPFPTGKLSMTWISKAYAALQFTSPVGTGLNPDEFAALANISTINPVLTLFQMGALCNNLEARTPRELEMSLIDYAILQKETAKYAVIWNEIAGKIIDEIDLALQQEESMAKAAMGKEPMKVVNGQA